MNIGTIKNKSRHNSTASKSESPKKSQAKPKKESSDSPKYGSKDSVKLDPESKEPKGDDKRVGSILGGLAESLGKGGKGGGGGNSNQENSDELKIEFSNERSTTVEIFWVNHKSEKEIPYGTIGPHGKLPLNSFIGHTWMVRDATTHEKIKEVIVGSGKNTAISIEP